VTRFRRAYISYNRLEWWYGHLSLALSRHLEVVVCPMARFNQPGHRVEADVTSLVGGGDEAAQSFYVGSSDQLFAGISDLPMRSAIWTDQPLAATLKSLPSLNLFDVVFSAQKDSVPALKHAGIKQVEWLPFAFDTTLRNDPRAAKVYDIGFVGSLELPATRAERVEVLGHLERKYRLNDYRRSAFGGDMMRVYNQSRIVVNIPWPGGLNMRTFEALASGALLLTKDIRNGQDDLFTDGTHLVTYRETNDLIEKIDYYLKHETERQEIACAGMREVLAHHTYDHRAARMLDVMEHASPARAHDRASHVAAYAAFYDYLGRADLLAGLAFDRGVPLPQRLRLLTRAALKVGRLAVDFRKRGGVIPERL
jgi:glycosyltransferase involved in cell wall biosynthesis